MQTTLLGLGLALITAILAAFAAPLFVDWNGWRPELEAQASALAGSRVTISGNIDLTLLPTPAFVLRDVSVGDAENGTGMRASEMRGSLSLPALLSGRFEADQFVVSRPAVRIAIGKDGSLVLPAGSSAGHELSVGGFVFEAGSLTIEDRRTNSLLLADDFSARGELVSREGPFRLDGGFRLNGVRWVLRASSGRFNADHAGKVRLSLERPADAFTFDAEGLLSLVNAALRFEGKLAAAQKSGALPWGITADAAGDVSELQLANLELSLGEGDLPITLSGEAKLQPHAKGSLLLSLTSRRIDLDLGDQKAATSGAAHVLPWLSRARDLLASLPVPAQVAISADGILAGGQLARDVRVSLRSERGLTMLERLEAKLPGRASVSLSGTNDGQAFFGPLSFESSEPQQFARWLLGPELAGKIPTVETLRFNAGITWSAKGLAFEQLRANIGSVAASGNAEAVLQTNERWLVRVGLDLAQADFGNLAIFGAPNSLPFDVWMEVAAKDARLLGKSAREIKFKAALENKFELHGATIADFEGLSLHFSQSTNSPGFVFEADATREGGLLTFLEYLGGNADLARIAARYAASHFPIRVSGSLDPQKSGWRAAMKWRDADLVVALGELRDAKQPIDATIRLPDTDIGAKGEFRFGKDGRFEPVLALTMKSSDLRSASLFAARAAGEALPASASAQLIRAGETFVFEKLVFDVAGTRGQGRISVPLGEFSPFAGELSLARASAEVLLSLALGRSPSADAELGVPPLGSFPGRLKMEIAALELPGRIVMQKAAFELRPGRYETVFDGFRGELAGGKVSGTLRIADTLPRVVELNFDADGVALAQILPSKSLRGSLQGSFAISANGTTQERLLASIAGQGKIALTALEIEQTDATSVAAVFNTTKDAPDEQKIEQALLAALARGPLKVSRIEAPLLITNGIFRSGSANAKAGNTEISLSGSFDLPKRSMDALLNIEVAGSSTVRPGATLRWQGAWNAPERKLDARALVTAITLRAIERGGQVPSNIVPQEERVAPPPKKRAPPNSETEAAPPLPPPSNVLSVPQPRQPQIQN